MGKNQHVTPHKDGGRQVKGENNLRATVRTNTQAEEMGIETSLQSIFCSVGCFLFPYPSKRPPNLRIVRRC